jgi:hypothetical protein
MDKFQQNNNKNRDTLSSETLKVPWEWRTPPPPRVRGTNPWVAAEFFLEGVQPPKARGV